MLLSGSLHFWWMLQKEDTEPWGSLPLSIPAANTLVRAALQSPPISLRRLAPPPSPPPCFPSWQPPPILHPGARGTSGEYELEHEWPPCLFPSRTSYCPPGPASLGCPLTLPPKAPLPLLSGLWTQGLPPRFCQQATLLPCLPQGSCTCWFLCWNALSTFPFQSPCP